MCACLCMRGLRQCLPCLHQSAYLRESKYSQILDIHCARSSHVCVHAYVYACACICWCLSMWSRAWDRTQAIQSKPRMGSAGPMGTFSTFQRPPAILRMPEAAAALARAFPATLLLKHKRVESGCSGYNTIQYRWRHLVSFWRSNHPHEHVSTHWPTHTHTHYKVRVKLIYQNTCANVCTSLRK